MNDQKIELSVNLVNAVVGYLVKQPFEQVAGLVSAIQQEARGEQLTGAQPQEVPAPPASLN